MITERPDPGGAPWPCDAEDAFSGWLELAAGTGVPETKISVSIDSTFAAPANLAPRVVVVGDEGVLECVADSTIVVRRKDGSREEHDRPAIGGDPHLTPMRRWAEVVRDAVDAGIAPAGAPTFVDGLACARVLDALRGA